MDTLVQAFVFVLLRDPETGCRLKNKDDDHRSYHGEGRSDPHTDELSLELRSHVFDTGTPKPRRVEVLSK